MDITENYTKMVDWPEIQNMWKCEKGDWYLCTCPDLDNYPNGYGLIILDEYDSDHLSEILPKSSTDTWLPLRHQLQKMSGLGWEQFDEKCFLAADRYLKSQRKYLCADEIAQAVSKEQAGIMVVMYELFQKKWDGEKWILKNNT